MTCIFYCASHSGPDDFDALDKNGVCVQRIFAMEISSSMWWYNMLSTIQRKNNMNWLYCWRASALDSINCAYCKSPWISLNFFLRFWKQCDWFWFNISKYPLRIGSIHTRGLHRLFSTMRPISIFKKRNIQPIPFNTCPTYAHHMPNTCPSHSSHKILLIQKT